MAGQSLTPEPDSLATASEPGNQAASVGDVEEKIKAPKPPLDKTKNEEVSESPDVNICLELCAQAVPIPLRHLCVVINHEQHFRGLSL